MFTCIDNWTRINPRESKWRESIDLFSHAGGAKVWSLIFCRIVCSIDLYKLFIQNICQFFFVLSIENEVRILSFTSQLFELTKKVFVIFLFLCDYCLSIEEIQSLFVIGFMSVMFVVAILNGQRCVHSVLVSIRPARIDEELGLQFFINFFLL